MTLPLITIGITCHNAADTIRRAIDSALAQDWPSLEILIVDDSSDDHSVKVIAEAIADEPRARLIRHEQNAGYAVALNTIIQNARGKFIAFFDDDDKSVPDRLRAQWERIIGYERETDARLVFCYSNRNVVEQGASQPKHESLGIGHKRPEPHGVAVADFLLSIGPEPGFIWGRFGSCTLMARQEAFLAAGAFDASFRRCAELDLSVRAALMEAHFIAVDRALVTQYKTWSPDKAHIEQLKYQLQLRVKHRDYLKSRNFFRASQAYAYSDFYGSIGEPWKRNAFRALAWLLSPALLISRLKKRFRGDLVCLARKVRS